MTKHTDNSEASGLADSIHEMNNAAYVTAIANLNEKNRQQAERIAELEARVHTCGPTCSKAGCINRRVTAERDQLRAEVSNHPGTVGVAIQEALNKRYD